MIEFIKGIVASLPLVLSVGPGTFYLMNAGLNAGSKKALWVVLGIWISDLLILALVISGNKILYEKYAFAFSIFLKIMAGLVSLMGFLSLFKKTTLSLRHQEEYRYDAGWKNVDLFFKGILVNGANPMNYLFWMSIVSLLAVAYRPLSQAYFSFLAGLMLFSLVGDLFKLGFSGLIKKILNERIIKIINIIVSIILIFAGIYFFFRI